MARGITVDWFLVRVNTVRRLLAVLACVIVAAVLGFLAYLHFNPAPDVRARRAIEQAEETREEVLATVQADAWQGEIEATDGILVQAKSAYGEERWGEAQTLAEGATTRLATLLSRARGDTEGVGHFFSIEGRIQVQRAGKAEWKAAHLRMPVFNGDFVKTSRDGAAEILFVDGSLYRVGPNSLLEIHHQLAAEQPPGTVRMVVGRINVYTADSPSTVTTDVAEAEIRRRSNVSVDVDEEERATKVAAFEGSAKVRNLSGEEMVVQDRELVAATRDGRFSEKRKIPEPPLPIDPHNNAGFELTGDRIIRLSWERPSSSNTVYLQVSRSQRFLEDQRDVDASGLRNDSARLKAISPGTYFWRVATLDDDVMSEWSAVRRFRIFSSDRESLLQDETPPPLNVTPAQQMGHLFIVRGQTEPGATVTINGEFVEVDGEGRFSKTVELGTLGWNRLVVAAVDPSGNRTERTERVYVEGVY